MERAISNARSEISYWDFGYWEAEASSGRAGDQKPGYSREFRFPNLSEGVQRYEISDPRTGVPNGFRNPLGIEPVFADNANMVFVLLLGVFCR